MNMTKKRIVTIFAAALLMTVAVLWLTDDSTSAAGQEKNTSQQNSNVAVEVARPSVKTINDNLPYLGTVIGTNDGNLSFRIGGTLDTIYVEESEKVQKGQLLALVSVPELDAQYRRTKSEFDKAQSSKAFWGREVATDSTLYKEGAISKTSFNKTAFNFEQALSGYHAAKAALEEVEERQKQTQLVAPAGGIIGSIMIREGSNLGPTQPVFFFHQGKPIMYADVLEQDMQKGIRMGTPVTATMDNGKIITGSVERIDAQARPPFRSVRVFVTFPAGMLTGIPSGAGFPLEFQVNRQEDALMVPISAIDLRNEKPRLLRVNSQSIVEAVPVKLGLQRGELRQISGSVTASDRIISSGLTNVMPGDQVQITNTSK